MTHFTLKTLGECLVLLAKKGQTKPLHLVLQFINSGLILQPSIPRLPLQFIEVDQSLPQSLKFINGPFRFTKNKLDNRRYTCNYDGDVVQTQALSCISETHSEIDDTPSIEKDFFEDVSNSISLLIKKNNFFVEETNQIKPIQQCTLSKELKELDFSTDLQVVTTLDNLARKLYANKYTLPKDTSNISFHFKKYFLDKRPINQQAPQYLNDRSKHLVHLKHLLGFYNHNLVSNCDNLIAHYDRKEKYSQPQSRLELFSQQLEKRKNEVNSYQQKLDRFENFESDYQPPPLKPSYYDREHLQPIKGGLQRLVMKKNQN